MMKSCLPHGSQCVELCSNTRFGMIQLDIHEDAESDLDRLWRVDPRAAAAVVATLQQLSADPRLIDKLTTHGNNPVGAQEINVKRWQRARGFRHGDLWRFRALNTPATSYRVVYGFHIQTRQVCVLGVAHKDQFDYDDLANPFAQRVIAAWRTL